MFVRRFDRVLPSSISVDKSPHCGLHYTWVKTVSIWHCYHRLHTQQQHRRCLTVQYKCSTLQQLMQYTKAMCTDTWATRAKLWSCTTCQHQSTLMTEWDLLFTHGLYLSTSPVERLGIRPQTRTSTHHTCEWIPPAASISTRYPLTSWAQICTTSVKVD